MLNKRGQFYLIASIVIVSVIIGFATIKNASHKPVIKVYDLGDELNIESNQIIEYGIIKKKMDETIEDFVKDYASYVKGRIDDLYFVVGNSKKIDLIHPKEESSGIINTAGTSVQGSKKIILERYSPGIDTGKKVSIENKNNKVIIIIPPTKYTFDLKPGENFYYVLHKSESNQKYITDNLKNAKKEVIVEEENSQQNMGNNQRRNLHLNPSP